MSLDARGQPIEVGVNYVLGAPLRLDAPAGTAVMLLADGRLVRCRTSDLVRVSDVDAGNHDHATLMPRDGSRAMTANLPMGGNRVVGLATPPVGADEAAPAGWCVETFLLAVQNLEDLPDKAVARANLGVLDTRLHRWLWGQGLRVGQSAFSGWVQMSEGGAAAYAPAGEFFTALQSSAVPSAATCDTGTAVSGTIAAMIRQGNRSTYLADNALVAFRLHVTSTTAELQRFRIGVWGNNVAPVAASEDPDSAVVLEFDAAKSATSLYLTARAGGVETAVDTGLDLADVTAGFTAFALRFESSTAVRLYSISPTADPVELAVATTNIPSTAKQRTGAMFFQAVKRNPGTSARAHVQVDLLELIAPDTRYGRLP